MTKAVIFSGPEKGPEINAALVWDFRHSGERSISRYLRIYRLSPAMSEMTCVKQ